MKRTAVTLAAALLLALAIAGKGLLVPLPDVPAQAEPGRFDTHRALARLQRVLGDQRPHPVDTPANDAVRSRLIAEIDALGLQPVVTDSFTCNPDRRDRAIYCARSRNIRVTVGPASGKHVLIVAHYDSTPVGPGASDDGIGMATMLEAAALLKDRPLARPVTFLFNEGEEAGLNGARAFLDHDPLAPQVDSLINLESRGVTGPTIMFETSRPNRAAIEAFAHAGWHPVANSLTADFYALIPNDTDVSVFKERPWTILNFAIIGNETRYHSANDRLESLDPRSLRHMGEQALAVATRLANEPPQARGGSTLYADLLGRATLALPQSLGIALLAGLVVLAGALAWQRRDGLGRALATVAVAVIGSGLLAWACQALIGLLRAGDFWRGHPAYVAAAIDVTAVSASLAAIVLMAAKLRTDRLRIAFWLMFLMIGGALSLLAPGAAIFFLVPPLAATVSLLLKVGRFGALLAAVLLFLSWAPLVHLSEELLDFDAGWIFAAVGALLALPFLIELKPPLGLRRPLLIASGVALLAAWAATLIPPAYSTDRKQPFGIEYAWDASERKAQWLVANDGAPLPAGFSGFASGHEVPWSRRLRWSADASPSQQVMPQAEKLAERRVNGGRLVRLRLKSNGIYSLLLRAPSDAALRAASANGSMARFAAGKPDEPYQLRCQGRSCEDLVVDVLVATPKPVAATLIGLQPGLPVTAAPLLRARSANASPQYMPDQTVTLVRLTL